MVVESLKIKTKSNYYYDDMVYLDDFGVKLAKVVRQISRIGVDIYYTGYVSSDIWGLMAHLRLGLCKF